MILPDQSLHALINPAIRRNRAETRSLPGEFGLAGSHLAALHLVRGMIIPT